MKLIIDIPGEVVTAIQNGEDYRYDIHTVIAQGISVSPEGGLISREALKHFVNYEMNTNRMYETEERRDSCYAFRDELFKYIDNAPTVKPPHGKWIRTGLLGNGNAQYECSICHYGDEQAESQEVPYCWHCGAKMDGGEE